MQLFDTHCHIDVEEFDDDRVQVLQAARSVGVRDLLVPAVMRSTWPGLVALCAADAHLHAALGMHPVYLNRHRPEDVDALADAVASQPPLAIGEIGLDWYVPGLDRQVQQRLLEDQLAVAEASHLPVVLHVRKAHDAMLNTLKRFRLNGGFCHAFNGSIQQAERYLEMGFRLGFGGMLTFERSTRLRRIAAQLPLQAIVLETDAPDMTVASHRYERNSPAYLPEVLETLARLRDLPAPVVAEQTTRNAREVLGL
ncbi:MAG: TatD family hydrolase [Chromatiaceae bacterium]|nr:TatD family hydrolase [Gammaproteobacteria bacterium]MCB1786096.1 TatD family hydrolase [Gammaproteobacteria bacterium]MCP5312313.1 TatD family hydrolase [Chromatiaceae bacterium]